MDQFMQIGGVIGSLKALMVFKDSIQINQRQCDLMFDILKQGYKVIAEEMKRNLKYDLEKKIDNNNNNNNNNNNTRWKILETPLKELLRVFKECELYIRQCMETKDLWAKTLTLYQNKDCVEFHLHNLLCCFPIVIEAIEITGFDQNEVEKKRIVGNNMKYNRKDFKDSRIFQWRFGHQYLINQELCNRLSSVYDEDRWILMNKIQEKKTLFSSISTKQDKRIADLLIKCLTRSSNDHHNISPYSILVGSKDYQVKKRLSNGSQYYKEIQWLGESFGLRHFHGDIKPPLIQEISQQISSLSHPNITHIFCGFIDDEKKECFLVMELMSKDLSSYIREQCGSKKRVDPYPFNLHVAVDLMLQIARGMEYLHANKVYHGDLTPSSILIKPRSIDSDGFLQAKVSGFGPGYYSNHKSQIKQIEPFIWHAPEVLEEQELGIDGKLKYTEKADVYSYGMICFEILTGKIPFEDTHLQGDKMSRNIRTGERPLFPFHSSKYLTSLTRKCWQSDPNQRPGFESICRVLRYVKRFLMMTNPDHHNDHNNNKQESTNPFVDYMDIENSLIKKSTWSGNSDKGSVSRIPYEMFVYRVTEMEKLKKGVDNSGSESDGDSGFGDECAIVDDPLPLPTPTEKKYNCSQEEANKKLPKLRKSPDKKPNKHSGKPKGRLERPLQIRNMKMNSETRRTSVHVSDSELS